MKCGAIGIELVLLVNLADEESTMVKIRVIRNIF